jgi:hypothetical protein
MIRTLICIAIGAALCLTATCGPARAAEPVDAATVCRVQSALRWGLPAWKLKRCQEVAAALSVLPEPVTMLAVAANESGMRADAIRRGGPGVWDVGLLGIRCHVVGGKCINGPARGYTPAQLMDPVINIRVAHVLATIKGPRWLHRWNGDPGYAARIAVLAAAIAGVPVEVTGKGAKWARIRAMVARIAKCAWRAES